MEEHKLVGSAFNTFCKAAYVNKRGQSDLGELSCWFQSFSFKKDGIILDQKFGGPCGALAAIQAFIIKDFFDPNLNLSREELLIKALLDIMEIIGPKFTICCDIDTSTYVVFKVTDSRETMHDYLMRSNFITNGMALYLYILGIIYASMGYNDLILPCEPYIYCDQFTTMFLVFLMLIGTSDESRILSIEFYPQTEIGIRVLKSGDQRVVGFCLNPGAKIVVCLSVNHFYAVLVNGDDLTVFDTLAGDTPRETHKPPSWT